MDLSVPFLICWYQHEIGSFIILESHSNVITIRLARTMIFKRIKRLSTLITLFYNSTGNFFGDVTALKDLKIIQYYTLKPVIVMTRYFFRRINYDQTNYLGAMFGQKENGISSTWINYNLKWSCFNTFFFQIIEGRWMVTLWVKRLYQNGKDGLYGRIR